MKKLGVVVVAIILLSLLVSVSLISSATEEEKQCEHPAVCIFNTDGEDVKEAEEDAMIEKEIEKDFRDVVAFANEEGASSEEIDYLELEALTRQNIQDMIVSEGDLDSIDRSIASIENYIGTGSGITGGVISPIERTITSIKNYLGWGKGITGNIIGDGKATSKEGEINAKTELADLHYRGAMALFKKAKIESVISIQRESTTESYGGATGCVIQRYSQIDFKIGTKTLMGVESNPIMITDVVTGWRFKGESDFKNICDFTGLDVPRTVVYRPLAIKICENKGKYDTFLQMLAELENQNYEIKGKKLEDIVDYQKVKEHFQKAINLLEEVKNYYYGQIGSIRGNSNDNTQDLYNFREAALKQASYYRVIGEYEKAITTLAWLEDSYTLEYNYPLPKKTLADIYIEKTLIETGKGENPELVVEYIDKAVEVAPDYLPAKKFKSMAYRGNIASIRKGTTERFTEIFNSLGRYTEFWDIYYRMWSPQLNTDPALDLASKEMKEESRRILGLQVLGWAVEEGWDLSTFYYDNVELPEKMYIEKNGKRVIRDDYIVDYGEEFEVSGFGGTVIPIPLYAFYGRDKRPDSEVGTNGENAVLLDIELNELLEYSNAMLKHREELIEDVEKLALEKTSGPLREDLIAHPDKFIDLFSAVQHVIRANPDIALLAAGGDYEKEIELLHKMGVFKSGAKEIPEETVWKSSPVTGQPYRTREIPSQHGNSEWAEHQIENFATNKFIYNNRNYPLYDELYKYTPIYDTWPDILIGFINPIDVGLFLVYPWITGTSKITVSVLSKTGKTSRMVEVMASGPARLVYNSGSYLFESEAIGTRAFFKFLEPTRAARYALRSRRLASELAWAEKSKWIRWMKNPLSLAGSGGRFVGEMGGAVGFVMTASHIYFPLYIPASIVVDVLYGGMHLNRLIPKIARDLGLHADDLLVKQIFTKNPHPIAGMVQSAETVFVMEVPTGYLKKTSQSLKSRGLERAILEEFLMRDIRSGVVRPGTPNYQYKIGKNSRLILRASSSSEVFITGNGQRLLNTQQIKEAVSQIMNKESTLFISDTAIRKASISYVVALDSLEALEEIGLAGIGPSKDGKFILRKGTGIPGKGHIFLKEFSGCCDNPVVYQFYELIQNGKVGEGFRNRWLYFKISDTGEFVVSEVESGLIRSACDEESIYSIGRVWIDSSGEFGEFVTNPAQLIDKKRTVMIPSGLNRDSMEASLNEVAKVHGYRGRDTPRFDESILPNLRNLIEQGKAARRPGPSYHDLMNGGAVHKEFNTKTKKAEWYHFDSNRNRMKFDPKVHRGVYTDVDGDSFVFFEGEFVRADIYGINEHFVGNTFSGTQANTFALVSKEERGTLRQYLVEFGDNGFIMGNPKRYNSNEFKFLWEMDTGRIYIEHEGALIKAKIIDTRSSTVLYESPSTGEYFVKGVAGEVSEPIRLSEFAATNYYATPDPLRIVREVYETRPGFVNTITGEAIFVYRYPEGTLRPIKAVYDFDIDAYVFENPFYDSLNPGSSRPKYLIQRGTIMPEAYVGAGAIEEPGVWRVPGQPDFVYNRITGEGFLLEPNSRTIRETLIQVQNPGLKITVAGEEKELSSVILYLDPENPSKVKVATEIIEGDKRGMGYLRWDELSDDAKRALRNIEDPNSGRIIRIDANGNFITCSRVSQSFIAGTKVLMADGSYKNIEDIKIGDFVMGFNEDTKENKASEVINTFHNSQEDNQGYLIINRRLKITKEHEVFINGIWMQIGSAKIGDGLKLVNGAEEIIESIEKIDEKVETFNLEIKDAHNYHAEDVLVHNARIVCPILSGLESRIKTYEHYARGIVELDPAMNLESWRNYYHGDKIGKSGVYQSLKDKGEELINNGWTWLYPESDTLHVFSRTLTVEGYQFTETMSLKANKLTKKVIAVHKDLTYNAQLAVETSDEVISVARDFESKGYKSEYFFIGEGEDKIVSTAIVWRETTQEVGGELKTVVGEKYLIEIGQIDSRTGLPMTRYSLQTHFTSELPMTDVYLGIASSAPANLKNIRFFKADELPFTEGYVKVYKQEGLKYVEANGGEKLQVSVLDLGDELQLYVPSDTIQGYVHPVTSDSEGYLAVVRGEEMGNRVERIVIGGSEVKLEESGFMVVRDLDGKPIGGKDFINLASKAESNDLARGIQGLTPESDYSHAWKGANVKNIFKKVYNVPDDDIVFELGINRAKLLVDNENMIAYYNPIKKEIIAAIPNSDGSITIIRGYGGSNERYFYLNKGEFKTKIKTIDEATIYWDVKRREWMVEYPPKEEGLEAIKEPLELGDDGKHGRYFYDEERGLVVDFSKVRKDYGKMIPTYHEPDIVTVSPREGNPISNVIYTNKEGVQIMWMPSSKVSRTVESYLSSPNPTKYLREVIDSRNGAIATADMERKIFTFDRDTRTHFYGEDILRADPMPVDTENGIVRFFWENDINRRGQRLIRTEKPIPVEYLWERNYYPEVFRMDKGELLKQNGFDVIEIIAIDHNKIIEQTILDGNGLQRIVEAGNFVEVRRRVISVPFGNKEVFVDWDKLEKKGEVWQVVFGGEEGDVYLRFIRISNEGNYEIIAPGHIDYPEELNPLKTQMRSLDEQGMKMYVRWETIQGKLGPTIPPEQVKRVDFTIEGPMHLSEDSGMKVEGSMLIGPPIARRITEQRIGTGTLELQYRGYVTVTIDNEGVLRFYAKKSGIQEGIEGKRIIFHENKLAYVDEEGIHDLIWMYSKSRKTGYIDDFGEVLMTTPDWEVIVYATREFFDGKNTYANPISIFRKDASEILGLGSRKVSHTTKITLGDFIDESVRVANDEKLKIRVGEFVEMRNKIPHVDNPEYRARSDYLFSEIIGREIMERSSRKTFFVEGYGGSRGGVAGTITAEDSRLALSVKVLTDEPVMVSEMGKLVTDAGVLDNGAMSGMIYNSAEDTLNNGYDRLVIMMKERDSRIFREMFGEHIEKLNLNSFSEVKRRNFLTTNQLLDEAQIRADPELSENIARWREEGLRFEEHPGKYWRVVKPDELLKDGKINRGFYDDFIEKYGNHPVILDSEVYIIKLNRDALGDAERQITAKFEFRPINEL